MIFITKSVLALMISFLIAIITSLILIPILKKEKAGQRLNNYLRSAHKEKEGNTGCCRS